LGGAGQVGFIQGANDCNDASSVFVSTVDGTAPDLRSRSP
jgi:hypothetical protein